MGATTYRVEGMSCGHCEAAVRNEVAALPGVTEVTADATAGTVVVTGDDVPREAVAAAVAEAGYEVVG